MMPHLANDVSGAASIAVEHLMKAGCRPPVFLNGEKEHESFSAFTHLKKSFLQALREGGIGQGNRTLALRTYYRTSTCLEKS